MSTSRITFGAVLNTVQASATMVTNSLDAVNSCVGMATTFIQGAADNQRIRAIADKETFIEDLIREKSYEQAHSSLKVNKFITQSTDHKEFYSSAYTKYTTLLRGTTEAAA